MYSAMNRSCAQWTRVLFLHNNRLSGRQQLPIGSRGLASPPPPPAISMGINKRQSDISSNDSKTAVPSVSSSGRRDPLDLSFDNAEAAFRSKTTLQVLRAYLVFTLCSSNYLVENNMKVINRDFEPFCLFFSFTAKLDNKVLFVICPFYFFSVFS